MRRSRTRSLLALAVALVAVVALLGVNASRQDPPAPAPEERTLAVDAATLVGETGYQRTGRFVGRVEFARASALSFELGGRVASVRVDEGDRVEAGDVLAALDTQRLAAQRAERVAELAEVRAERDLARLRDQRARKLVEQDVISPQDADDTRLALTARESGLARVAARIASIDVDLAKSTLVAPFPGRIAAREVDEGVVVEPGAPVLRLLETARPEVRVGVPRDVAARIGPGETHTVRIHGREHRAVVRSVLPERGAETRTVSVILTLDGADGSDGPRLRSGDLAELRWHEPVDARGAWLRRDALTEGARGLWAAYVALPDASGSGTHRLERRPVERLHEDGDRVYVRGAIRPGEPVVRSGVHRLVPGQVVTLANDEAADLATTRASADGEG